MFPRDFTPQGASGGQKEEPCQCATYTNIPGLLPLPPQQAGSEATDRH